MNQQDKTELLQAFLDTSKFATDMFDLIDSGKPIPYVHMIRQVNNIANALIAAREALIADYVASGSASNDILARIRRDLEMGAKNETPD